MKTPIIFMSETEVLEAKNKKVFDFSLDIISSIEQYPIVLYKCDDLYGTYSYFYNMNDEENIKIIQQAKFWSDVKNEYKQPLEHKQLVWIYYKDSAMSRALTFYDVTKDYFYSTNGTHLSEIEIAELKIYNIIIEPYEGEWPEWAKEAYNKLED
ncbi:MAG: hypothetical protein PVF17_00055 [Ignavibacteria bacterium]|jgi:hypothetical protein